ncbi:hypothetical protein WN48_07698 [Eufriesea mexicana]|uniref:Uncharacterized protein n=1 Tax=Eufriesea mexicana TaxID=516756 RepID=A0A310SJ44_9HYME|nr:hypothetical protein WN48_07698 [Eufriesea mexicana]
MIEPNGTLTAVSITSLTGSPLLMVALDVRIIITVGLEGSGANVGTTVTLTRAEFRKKYKRHRYSSSGSDPVPQQRQQSYRLSYNVAIAAEGGGNFLVKRALRFLSRTLLCAGGPDAENCRLALRERPVSLERRRRTDSFSLLIRRRGGPHVRESWGPGRKDINQAPIDSEPSMSRKSRKYIQGTFAFEPSLPASGMCTYTAITECKGLRMGQAKAHWRGTLRQRVQSRRDWSWLWWRVHLPLERSTLRTLAQARLHQSARSIRRPRAPRTFHGNRLCFGDGTGPPGHVFSPTAGCQLAGSLDPRGPGPSRAFFASLARNEVAWDRRGRLSRWDVVRRDYRGNGGETGAVINRRDYRGSSAVLIRRPKDVDRGVVATEIARKEFDRGTI